MSTSPSLNKELVALAEKCGGSFWSAANPPHFLLDVPAMERLAASLTTHAGEPKDWNAPTDLIALAEQHGATHPTHGTIVFYPSQLEAFAAALPSALHVEGAGQLPDARMFAASCAKEGAGQVDLPDSVEHYGLIDERVGAPSEGVGEQIAHIKQAIYTISGGDFDATDDEARRIAEAVLSLSPSRGEAVDAAKELLRAVELEMSPEWECNSYHPAIAPAVERLKAAIQSQGRAK